MITVQSVFVTLERGEEQHGRLLHGPKGETENGMDLAQGKRGMLEISVSIKSDYSQWLRQRNT